MKVFIQPEYEGREVLAVRTAAPLMGFRIASAKDPDFKNPAFLHVGSVEFIESIIGPWKPDFYPEWTRPAWFRSIRQVSGFVKSASHYKEIEPRVGDWWFSDPVNFTVEWRHYCADGASLCSWWYQGDEESCDQEEHGPPLPFDLPAGFCGAVDIGRLDTGAIALVEVHHPYAIGWYGESRDAINYFRFLLRGWDYLTSK